MLDLQSITVEIPEGILSEELLERAVNCETHLTKEWVSCAEAICEYLNKHDPKGYESGQVTFECTYSGYGRNIDAYVKFDGNKKAWILWGM